MENIVINAELREVKGKQVKALRREGKLPAVLYGRHTEPVSVVLPLHETTRILERLQQSALVSVVVDGEAHLSLVREKQRNYLTGGLLHIDFLVVSATEILRTDVAVEVVGDAPAVKNLNGVLMVNISTLEVEALPKDLPELFQANVEGLKEIGSAFYVRDLVVPSGVTVLNDGDEIIAIVTFPAAELEEEDGGQAEPEVIEKGKKDEDED